MSDILLISASNPESLNGETPESIVYLPKGSWNINPTVNGKPDNVEVMVDADSAKILQESLDERLKDTIRPYAAFDHRPGPASFLPKAFRWDEEKGVILDLDWTKSGKEAVTGRDYSYFSPTFYLRDKKVVGLPKDGEIGSLTNNPAFRKIQKIAASADPDEFFETGVKLKPKNMGKVADKLIELKVITAQQAEEGDEDLLIRAIGGLHDTLVMSQKANDMLTAENTNLKLRVQASEVAEAEKLIEAAIQGGTFPAKDADTIQFFKEQYLVHPEQTKKVLQSLTGNKDLFKPVVNVKREGQQSGMSGPELIQAQKNVIKEIQETNPAISFDTAFNKAKLQRPELFVEA